MAGRFCSGDKILCKIKGNSIVCATEDQCDIQLEFEIIGGDEDQKYIIFVPKYFSIKNSWNIIEEHLVKYDISSRYLDCKGIVITEDKVLKISKSKLDGMFCANCEEFFAMAEPNQPDGTLLCFSCRSNPWR